MRWTISFSPRLEKELLPTHEIDHPFDYGMGRGEIFWGYWVEWRSSGALSGFAGSAFVSDATGSILLLSTRGVSTRAATSALGESIEPVSTRCSERGRATARAISICVPPW